METCLHWQFLCFAGHLFHLGLLLNVKGARWWLQKICCFDLFPGRALVRVSNQEFQVTILLIMVFDFQGIVFCMLYTQCIHTIYTHHL